MQRKLNAYKGKLSAAQIASGMNAAAQNARRLAEDAASLLAAGRFPTAAFLAILSIEEAGKISILRGLALARSGEEAAEAWKDYRSHTHKNVSWILPQLVAAGARRLGDLRPMFDETSDHPFVLDQLKQLGMYTDCLGHAHWSSPAAVIDGQLAKILVQIAQIFGRDEGHTQKEIELWIEHMGPVWKKDQRSMQQALVSWYEAMQGAGLAPEGPNEMEQFIHYGLQKRPA